MSDDMYSVLKQVVDHGGACSRDVAKALGMTVKKASTYLSRLHAKGLVTRGKKEHSTRTGQPVGRIWWPR